MKYVSFICSAVVLSPFMLIGFFMHLCFVGYTLVTPFVHKLFMPSNTMIISLGEIEKFTNDFLEKNPDKTVEDAVEAFMRMKQK
jgi:hypothetical protein